jgi:hypothetical protein
MGGGSAMKRAVTALVLVTLAGCGGGESAGGESSGNAPSLSPEPAGVTVELAISYNWGKSVPNWVNKDPGADCYDYTFKNKDVQILDNAGAILTVGEFPQAGVFEWDSETTGTCTWTTSLGVVGASPVYTVKTGVGSETMNADELADGLVNLGAKSGAFGYGWLSICPGDVDCKKYES